MRQRARTLPYVVALSLYCGATPVAAAEFRSVGEGGAVFFDAPSAQATKLYVARRYYPVSVVVSLEQWVKVRDAAGDLAWVEKRALSEQRTVIVTAPRAHVRAAPEAAAPVAFDVEKDVALEVLEIAAPGWVKVGQVGGQAGGQSGFVSAAEVWGL
jgi:SH3-like domain-containing protein